MLPCLMQLWMRIYRASWSIIMLLFINAFGIFFRAKMLFVLRCFTRFTQPNLPSPSFLSIIRSSRMPPLVGVETGLRLGVAALGSSCGLDLRLGGSMRGDELNLL